MPSFIRLSSSFWLYRSSTTTSRTIIVIHAIWRNGRHPIDGPRGCRVLDNPVTHTDTDRYVIRRITRHLRTQHDIRGRPHHGRRRRSSSSSRSSKSSRNNRSRSRSSRRSVKVSLGVSMTRILRRHLLRSPQGSRKYNFGHRRHLRKLPRLRLLLLLLQIKWLRLDKRVRIHILHHSLL